MKSGFITILGKPNVGKSSLMNALIGEKVSIVSPKAQTTRDRVNGILTTSEYQMVFVDTPGVHKPRTKLGEYMDKCVKGSTDGVDAVVIVIDGTKKINDGDITFIEKYLKMSAPVYVAINKVDMLSYEKVYPMLEKLNPLMESTDERNGIVEIVPVSAKRNKNIDVLKKYLVGELKEGPCYYPEDEITDKSERYMICEIVREKALLFLNDEIPHGIGVSIANMNYDDYGTAKIFVDITCERESHKSIIIGAGGEKLKLIAERSRKEIERMLDSKVYMELFVKVREDWRNDGLVLSDIGYDARKLKK